MSRYNKGTVFTNDRCIGCNRCIAYCKNLGANVSIMNEELAQIQVDSKKCSDCGVCIRACLHGAREYRDDCELFLQALGRGEKISVIVSTTFYVVYRDKAAQILGYLKSLGVDKIYDMAYGAEISTWAQCRYLKENESLPNSEKAFISPMCPALVNEIEMYHPRLLRKLIPVQSPMMCTAIYVNKYLGDTNKLAYLSPCIAVKDEISAEGRQYNLEYNVTYTHLMKALYGQDLSAYSATADLQARAFGNIIPMIEGFKETVGNFFDRNRRIDSYWNLDNETYEILEMSAGENGSSVQPLIAEVFACGNGCQEGPGIEPGRRKADELYAECTNVRTASFSGIRTDLSPQENWELLEEMFTELKTGDFVRFYTDKFRQGFLIPESTYNEIFESMLKDTPAKKNINCGSCGYDFCKEMAMAIAYGYNRKENCIHYMNDNTRRNSMFSPVAGLYSETAFLQLARKMLDEHPEEKYMVFYGDINKLKLINDIYGFEKGDYVLEKIGEYITHLIDGKGIAAYVGGGAYVVFTGYDQKALGRNWLTESFDFSDADIRHRVTMHIGLYVAEDAAENVRSMLSYAEMASKENVSLIHNTVTTFSPESRDLQRNESDISSQMIRAVDNNEFVLWYQPQFNTFDNSVVGAEALCRWLRPDGTLMTPSRFIPIAEKNGFIRTLDKAVWKMAFAAVRQWLDNGITPPPISLNISRMSLETDEFIPYIVELRDRYKVANHFIQFEITEGVYFGNQDNIIANINKLRKLGYKIAMDDFGSGYSSLNSLKDMPIDILKLDMGFIRNEQNLDRGGTIISAVARMAQDLEFITVAEGVETQLQADFLTSIGISCMQGYLFSNPLPAREFAELIQTNKVAESSNPTEELSRFDVGHFFDPASYESQMFETFSGPAGIFEYNDSDDSIMLVRANKAGLEMLGCENKPFAELQRAFDRYAESDRGSDMVNLMKTVSERKEKLATVIGMREQKHLNEIWLRITIHEIGGRAERHVMFVAIDDVTNEKIAENMLELSNRQLAFLLDTDRVGSCLLHVTAAEGGLPNAMRIKILRVNSVFADNCGYTVDEMLAWSEREFVGMIHPLDKAGFLHDMYLTARGQKLKDRNYTYRILQKSGYFVKVSMILTSTQLEDSSYMISVSMIRQEE